MHRSKFRAVVAAAAALAVCGSLWAASVLQMNLEQMVDRADKIFRGTVMTVREGTVRAGGADLPTVTYRVRVDESFKGTFQEIKGLKVAEITMLGKLKASETSATVQSFSALPELPKLKVGQDYLLLTTPPSAIGLSTTIGLVQGAFVVGGKPGQEVAVNGNHNLGLFHGISGPSGFAAQPQEGPVPYAALAGLIRDFVGQ